MTEKCLECNEPATWTRSTQFAGDHPYCDKHARLQSDFNDEPDSYAYWVENILAGEQSTCDDSGYEESTHEKQAEFAKNRNYKYE